MSLFARIRWALACGLVCGVVLFQSGDVLTYWRLPFRWASNASHMVLQVGSSWSGAAQNALSVWNGSGSRFRFSSGTTSASQRISCTAETVDRRNVVVWSSNNCGEAWNPSTLALTRTWFSRSSGAAVDSDVLFNSNRQWGLYRGNLRSGAVDFERVAIHEFGHVLGLGHPDEHGQSVNAIMNSRVSNIDTIQSDDIAGAVAIYGGTGRPGPPTDGCTLEDFGIVSTGSTVVRRTGTLGRDCVSPNRSGRLARYYSFRLDRTSNLRIDMSSSIIDPWLALRRGANIRGAQLAFDDDGGSGLNSRIDQRLEAGIYTIEATSFRQGETGSFNLALTVVPVGLPPTVPGRTNPTTLDLTCHGYDEGATRAYNCTPEPSQQRYMQTFVPAVGSACDGGSIAEFPAGRIVFQIRCRDDSPGQSAPWSYSGQGPGSFVKPSDVSRVWVRTAYPGSSARLSVWCRAPQGNLVVNELLGTSWGNDGTNGNYGMAACLAVEVDTGAEDLQWWFSQEPAATALTPPRSWKQATGAGSALGAEALQDLATAAELERLWRQPDRWQMNPGQGASTRGALLTSADDRVANLVASKPDPTDALDGGIVRDAVRTSPLALDFTCHGYDEGATRAYNCIPEPSQQHLMRTFVPAVGSACDGGSIAEFPAGRIVFQIRCRDNSPGQSAPWSYSGQGPASFAKPIDTPRVWLRTSFSGSSAHLSVWCRAPQESLVVNELLGTSWGNDGTNGIYGMAGCGEVEVDTAGGEDLHWWFTQETAATALTPPRSWEQTTGAGRAVPAEARQDLATAVELERLWPRHGR